MQSTGEPDTWVQAEPEDVRIFEEAGLLKQQFHQNSPEYSKIIGFIDMFRTGKEMVFRIKDTTQMQNNTGTRIAGHTPTKGDLVKRLNEIVDSSIHTYNSANTKEITQFGLGIIIEMILRYRTLEKTDGKIWFMNPEDAAYNKISKYRKL